MINYQWTLSLITFVCTNVFENSQLESKNAFIKIPRTLTPKTKWTAKPSKSAFHKFAILTTPPPKKTTKTNKPSNKQTCLYQS